jgi:propionyl-CoA synthetase
MKAHEMFLNSIENKEQFWAEQAEKIQWFKKPQNILSEGETITLSGLQMASLMLVISP